VNRAALVALLMMGAGAFLFMRRAGAAAMPSSSPESSWFEPAPWPVFSPAWSPAPEPAPVASSPLYSGAPGDALDWWPAFDPLADAAAADGPEVLLDDVVQGPGVLSLVEEAFTPAGGYLMTQLNAALGSPNTRAFLDMIAFAEGTDGPDGYRMLFGGGLFDSFADHPRLVVRRSGYASSAAGRYQILRRTWDDVQRVLKLPDFSPGSQDVAAVFLLRRRGALSHVLAGRFDRAVDASRKEWASLPGAGYGQPERRLADLRDRYRAAGGLFEGTALA
jgi:muramidase (phage lysozyme)